MATASTAPSAAAVSASTAGSVSAATSASLIAPRQKLKILMLHGFTQSGTLFRAKTRALEKALQKFFPPAPTAGHLPDFPGGVELVYATGPIRLEASDVVHDSASPLLPRGDGSGGKGPPSVAHGLKQADSGARDDTDADSWAWWKKDEQTGEYRGLEDGLTALAELLKARGPFAGVIGFSQGAAAAAMLGSLLEPGRKDAFGAFAAQGQVETRNQSTVQVQTQVRAQAHVGPLTSSPPAGMPYPRSFLADSRDGNSSDSVPSIVHPPFLFAVSYAGFPAPHPAYTAFYKPQIVTPLLHFIGSLDTVVEESRSLALVEACAMTPETRAKRVVYYPGGHFVPSQKAFLNALCFFIRECLSSSSSSRNQDLAQG